jgi:putative flippase GtrA
MRGRTHFAGAIAPNLRARALLWMRHHPVPRFLVTGGLTFCLDISALKLLHGVANVSLIPATILAFAGAFLVNFTLSRQWAFVGGRSGAAHRQMLRFCALVLLNLVLTVVIVSGLVTAGVNYLAAKFVSAAINAIGNFFAYRHWVFR